MQVTTYCEKLIEELDAWKEKADHIARELDNLAPLEKGKMLPEIMELHMFVEELCERMYAVKNNCLEAWEPAEIGVMMVRVHKTGNWGKDWEDALLGKTGG